MAIKNHQSINTFYGLLSLGAMLFISSCEGSSESQLPLENKPEVSFVAVDNGAAKVDAKYPGTVEGKVNVDIKAQATGYLEVIYVKEGDYVNKGQNLFRIKGDALDAQINNNKASLNAALANQANAALEVEKIRPLVVGKVVTMVQLQTAEASYKAASANVEQAKAALKSAQINADFSLIKAPVSGYIGRIPNRIGNLVTPGDTTPLTTLSEIDEVFVYFSVSDADFTRILKAGKSNGSKITGVELILSDGSDYGRKGRLETASGSIDKGTGSITMKAVFANPDKLLRSGGSVRVVINSQLSEVLTVPIASVRDIQDKFFVFTLGDSNKVSMVPISVAGTSGSNYLVKQGIKPGDRIAADHIENLSQGMVVNPVSSKTGNHPR